MHHTVINSERGGNGIGLSGTFLVSNATCGSIHEPCTSTFHNECDMGSSILSNLLSHEFGVVHSFQTCSNHCLYPTVGDAASLEDIYITLVAAERKYDWGGGGGGGGAGARGCEATDYLREVFACEGQELGG